MSSITLPKISNIQSDNNELTFTIDNINVSLVNAIRRTILSEIPTVVIRTTPYEKNDAEFITNTTRFHNEMLKHRLSCIPIHITDLSINLDHYIIECNVKNDTDSIVLVTTEHFKIKNINTDKYLSKEDTRKIFPPDSLTKDFIVFTKLRPAISDDIKGEHIHFKAKMTISNVNEDSTFNVVSTCSYSFNIDPIKQDQQWSIKKKELQYKNLSQEQIIDEKNNWYLQEGKRFYKEDSFNFIIKTIGVFTNENILKKSCDIIIDNIQKILSLSLEQTLEIKDSNTSMMSYDVVLNNDDYTIGKSIEYALYELYYKQNNIFGFVGFKKEHPHDNHSIIRLSFIDETNDKNSIYGYINQCCENLITIFNNFKTNF
jgi:DNA-directed RNA polymerase subunit L